MGELPAEGLTTYWITEKMPKTIEAIRGGEDKSSYRIVIIGEGQNDSESPTVSSWQDWTYLAGVKHRKRHESIDLFTENAKTLLGEMHKYYRSEEQPPTDVLVANGIPVAYFGDS